MSSAHLVDPETRFILETFPSITLANETLAQTRQINLGSALADDSLPVDVRELKVPGPAGAPDVRILAYRPRGAAEVLPAFLDIHGGGFVLGSPEMTDAANRSLAAELGCALYAVAYRLAPETPYPGPVEDCYAALRWMFDNAKAEGLDPTRIGISGGSGGGGLAAATALLARDRGEVKLAFQHLLCPMLDDRTATRDISPVFGEYIWTREHNIFGWRSMIGGEPGGPDVPAYCSPARAEDLAGLPPTFINVGSLDLFLEEDMEYARRLAAAGVPVELHVYPGGVHGFEMAAESRLAKAAMRDSVNALRRSLFG